MITIFSRINDVWRLSSSVMISFFEDVMKNAKQMLIEYDLDPGYKIMNWLKVINNLHYWIFFQCIKWRSTVFFVRAFGQRPPLSLPSHRLPSSPLPTPSLPSSSRRLPSLLQSYSATTFPATAFSAAAFSIAASPAPVCSFSCHSKLKNPLLVSKALNDSIEWHPISQRRNCHPCTHHGREHFALALALLIVDELTADFAPLFLPSPPSSPPLSKTVWRHATYWCSQILMTRTPQSGPPVPAIPFRPCSNIGFETGEYPVVVPRTCMHVSSASQQQTRQPWLHDRNSLGRKRELRSHTKHTAPKTLPLIWLTHVRTRLWPELALASRNVNAEECKTGAWQK